jgi:predicted metal-dependent peptidase
MNVEESKETEDIPTMAINQCGRIVWNRDFVMKQSDEQLCGLLAHEAGHIWNDTFGRQDWRDHQLWNIATDIMINYLLTQDGMTLPEGGWVPDANGDIKLPTKDQKGKIINVAKLTCEEVYDAVEAVAEKVGIAIPGDPNGDGDGHGGWDQHIKDNSMDEEDKEAEKNKWKKVAIEAATAAKMRGKLSSAMERHCGDLLEPEVDWRTVLYQFITNNLPYNYTMVRPGKKSYSTGVYFPTTLREELEVLVAIDTSGSIDKDEYNKFLTEALDIAGAFKQIKMRIIWWSTRVAEGDDMEVTTSNRKDILAHQPRTGGTTMSCVADYCNDKNYQPPVVVMLTDGEIEYDPKLIPSPHIFVVSKRGNTEIVEKLGRTVKLRLDK